jgi:hypothetical protein
MVETRGGGREYRQLQSNSMSRVLVEKLIVAELAKKFPSLMGTVLSVC